MDRSVSEQGLLEQGVGGNESVPAVITPLAGATPPFPPPPPLLPTAPTLPPNFNNQQPMALMQLQTQGLNYAQMYHPASAPTSVPGIDWVTFIFFVYV